MILAAGACWLSQEHVTGKDNKATLKRSGLHHYDITQLFTTYNIVILVSFSQTCLYDHIYFNQDQYISQEL